MPTVLISLLAMKLLYLKNIILILVIAIAAANILNEFGITKRMAFTIRPLIRFSRLPEEAGASIITFVASGSAGSAMLASFHERGMVDERETIIASIISNFFSFLNHALIYYLPIVVPILGLTAGMLYVGSRFAISLSVTLVAATIGHFLLKSRGGKVKGDEDDTRTAKQKVVDGLKHAANVLKKILPRLVAIYLVTTAAIHMGWFDVFDAIEPALMGLPGEASAIIAIGFADTTSAVIFAGSLLNEGMLTAVEVVAALLLTSIVSMSVVLFRHSLPGKIVYFGAKLGTKIAIYNAILNLFFTILALGVFLALI